jgi:hypothetical protein
LKASIGEQYFEPSSLVEFVRFNFCLRRAFFRLLQTDIHAMRRTLDELEKEGHSIVDCTAAGLSAEESLAALRQKCVEWKKPFQASYSAGPLPFAEIVAVRAALARALTMPPLQPKPSCVETQSIASPEPTPPVLPAVEVAPGPAMPAPVAAEAVLEVSIPETAPQVLEEVMEVKPQMPAAIPVAAKAVEPPQPSPIAAPAPAPVMKQEVAAKPAAAPKPAALPKMAAPTAPPPAPKAVDVQGCLENIAEQLFATAGKAASAATTVIVGSAKVVLSSWEVEAFVRGGDEVCDTLQRAVAARAVLSEAVEHSKRGGGPNGLPSTISLAQTEAASAQLQIEAAKKARNLDAAVNLAATAKRLLALITEAQNLASVPAPEMAR